MFSDIKEFFIKNKLPNFRFEQFETEIFKFNKTDFAEMNLLPKELRVKLKLEFRKPLSLVSEKVFIDSDNYKFLLRTKDGFLIESVVMFYKNRTTLCVSTQINCAVGCKFCASGSNKFVRDLNSNEIISQVILVNNLLFRKFKKNVTNIVFMGMGEPFLNFTNLLQSIDILNKNLNIGQRRILVSTVGIPDKIIELAKFSKQIKLAISLHAPYDELRSKLIPLNKKYSIEKLFFAIDKYVEITNKRVSYEYILIADINDNLTCAKRLVELLKKRKAFVDLIPFNEHQFSKFKKPDENKIKFFLNYLKENRIEVTIRDSKGEKIDGACGQLVATTLNQEKKKSYKFNS